MNKLLMVSAVLIVVVAGIVTYFLVTWVGPENEEGGIEEDFTILSGWSYEGRRINEPYLFDVNVVRLNDGRYRLYGEASDIGGHTVVSYISDDGLNFQKENGYRLTGAFMPFAVKLPDGRFRLYFTDQQVIVGQFGGRAIMSAISTDGVNFNVENGDRLTYGGSGHESGGIRGAKILQLGDGSYRMYYHGIDGSVHWRVLSAVSQDGLSWTRENGVRLDPSELCANVTRIGNVAPFMDPDGGFHLYVAAVVYGGGGTAIGIFDAASTNGLTFTTGSAPVVGGYVTENNEVNPEDPAVITTDNGLRMYFAPYGTQGSVIPESGIYSVLYQGGP